MTYDLPIYEQLYDAMDARRTQGKPTSAIVMPFDDWQRLVMMIGASTATVKLEYGKLTWLTKYGEVVCTPANIEEPRYEP